MYVHQSKLAMVISKLSLLLFLLLALVAPGEGTGDELSTYIIHVQPQQELGTSDDTKAWHQSFLPEHGRLLHSYQHAASGFAARLTRRELDVISSMPGFVAAMPDVVYKVQTPLFLSVGSGQGIIVIGLLDTGIFPDHPSFDGFGMFPPSVKWKGRCDFNCSACNSHKLIRARSFISGGNSTAAGVPVPPTDKVGHGTHTSSTAAGAVVPGAQVLGLGSGIASGIAPEAHPLGENMSLPCRPALPCAI